MTLNNKEHYLPQLRAAIEQLHGSKSTYKETIAVREVFHGKTVWEGDVEVFELSDHPKATVCYAWKFDDKETKTARIAAIPGIRLIKSPADAVRTFIMAENRKHSV